ncbi:GTPase Era [Coriobacteriia bacterium Es71-Z0120]|uniref:GTPase Era n=1 Tax=Parvivirga hydrogeniphila TaxID=2939460 RepID=UPI0022608229|nr:GTPase Era [Parvivirga hydrogeniphila]MCL4078998.1 GTPase Era [Parvivirga hydrogeniphila]
MSAEASSFEVVRSGFAVLVGRPNAGKSTLLNALVGEKVAIVSSTPQTTRHRLRGIVDRDDAQVVFVDTPGLHRPHDALGEELNRSAVLALSDVDVACLVIDASAPVGPGDRWVAHRVQECSAAKVLVLTKVDLVKPKELDRQMAVAQTLADFDDIVACSGRTGFNVNGVVNAVVRLLPEGPRYFPRDMRTDQPVEVLIAELIRERVLHLTREEVPHAVGVVVDDIAEERGGVLRVSALIYVERESQKGIIIGKDGEMIRRIGSEARPGIERIVGAHVFLDLRVKVKRDWRRDASSIRRFGYGEGL